MKKRIWSVVFSLYCALMLWLLFARTGYVEGLPYQEQMKMNLVPLVTIQRFIRQLGYSGNPPIQRHAFVNLFGNIIMFIPLGFLLPKVFPWLRKFWKTLLATAVIIVLVEVTQLLTLLGSCDTDDLILNVLGAAIGYAIHKIAEKSLSE